MLLWWELELRAFDLKNSHVSRDAWKIAHASLRRTFELVWIRVTRGSLLCVSRYLIVRNARFVRRNFRISVITWSPSSSPSSGMSAGSFNALTKVRETIYSQLLVPDNVWLMARSSWRKITDRYDNTRIHGRVLLFSLFVLHYANVDKILSQR